MDDLYWSSWDMIGANYSSVAASSAGHCTVTGVLHPGGKAQHYLCLWKMIQVYELNTAQLQEPGSCS